MNKHTILLLVLLVPLNPVAAELKLEQEYVAGFPTDGLGRFIPYRVGHEGQHRLAVVNGGYLLGLQWSPRDNTYEQRFFVQGEFGDILVMADIDGDHVDEIVTLDSFDDVITVHDPVTGARRDPFPIDDIRGGTAQDLDGVPGNELLVLSYEGVSAYKGGELSWHWAAPGSDFQFPAAGRGSTTQDVVLKDSNQLIFLDAQTGTERRRLSRRCTRLALGQMDADDHAEIACYSSDERTIHAIDATTGEVQWSRHEWLPFFSIVSLAMVDADGDGRQDVAVGTDNFAGLEGIVEVLQSATGEPFHDPRPIAWGAVVAAVSLDCEDAIVVAEGVGTSDPDKLHLLDPMTLASRGVYVSDEDGIAAMAVADLDADSRNELIVYHDAKVTTLGIQPFSRNVVPKEGSSCCGFTGMATVQLDGDSAREYVLAGVSHGYTGSISAFDGVTHERMWMVETGYQEIPRTVQIADLNGDGENDIVTAVIAYAGGAQGQFVYAFRGSTGARLWRSLNIPGLNGRVLVGDVDADGAPDVLALSRQFGLVRLKANGTVGSFDEFPDGQAFALLNADADPQLEIVVAADGLLFILDEGKRVETPLDRDWTAAQIKIADVDGDGTAEILLARFTSSAMRLEVRAIAGLALLWTSEPFPARIGYHPAEVIEVADVDNDGRTEVLFRSSLSVRIFAVGDPPADTVAPRFETGAALTSQVHVANACCANVHLQWDAAGIDASPPLLYQIHRAGPPPGDTEVLIGSTYRNEFIDATAGAATRYRYTVRVIDGAGNAAAERLSAEVSIRAAATCRRRAIRK